MQRVIQALSSDDLALSAARMLGDRPTFRVVGKSQVPVPKHKAPQQIEILSLPGQKAKSWAIALFKSELPPPRKHICARVLDPNSEYDRTILERHPWAASAEYQVALWSAVTPGFLRKSVLSIPLHILTLDRLRSAA